MDVAPRIPSSAPSRSRLRTWTAAALILALSPFLLVSLIPFLYGKAPAVGISAVEQSLCALDPEGRADFIAGGDSRGLYHVVPAVIDSVTGKRCINVSKWTHLGGDPISLVNALRRSPTALAGHPTVILSVTIDGANDLGFKGLPLVSLLNWGALDHLRVLRERPKAYPLFIARELLPSLALLTKNRLAGKEFRCDDDIYLPERVRVNRGADFYVGRKTSGFWRMPGTPQDYLLDGGQWGNLRSSLAWLARSGAGRVVLLHAPIDTAWLARTDGPVAVAMIGRFSDMLAREAGLHPKVMLLDYVRHPLPELADSLWHDQTHLNREGAELFSRKLGERLLTIPGKAAPPG